MNGNELIGMKFGKLTVLEEVDSKIYTYGTVTRIYRCRCDCGNESVVRSYNLKNGHTKTCGHCRPQQIVDHEHYLEYFSASGKSFIFDREDIDKISPYRWNWIGGGYFTAIVNGERTSAHRHIICADKDHFVDHINGNVFDCRKANLRLVNKKENASNMKTPKSNTVGYKGVCYAKRNHAFMAQIHPAGKMRYLGYYKTPEEAAAAYNQAAISLYGEYARINVIGQPYATISAKEVAGS